MHIKFYWLCFASGTLTDGEELHFLISKLTETKTMRNCTLETYITLLPIITPIKLKSNNKKKALRTGLRLDT